MIINPTEQIVQVDRAAEHPMAGERPPCAKEDRERAGHREEHDRRHERHQARDHRFGQGGAVALQRVDHQRPAARLRRREIARPRVHAAGHDGAREGLRPVDVPGEDVQPEPAAEPVEGGQAHAEQHPPEVHRHHRGEEALEVVPVEQQAREPEYGDRGEDFESAAEQAGVEQRHEAANLRPEWASGNGL
jgi:hypothetical protein